MCGFGGIISSNKISREELDSVAKKVNYRGPNFTGISLFDRKYNPDKYSGNIGIFHNRLSIIDNDPGSNQPFEDDHHILVFNGEIYNFHDLKKRLILAGFRFNTSSDTEVLFLALKAFGTSIISQLNGMFAFAFIDKKSGSLILARDRVGIKPIYFSLDNNSFIFASEIDTIVRLKKERSVIDQNAITLYKLFQYIPDPKTIWKGIESISPGCLKIINFDQNSNITNIKEEKYWDAYTNRNFDYSGNDLLELLRSSLEGQLIANVPLGLSLSSGIDSSLLAVLIQKYFKEKNLVYFTIAFEENCSNDESKMTKKFIDSIGINPKSFRKIDVNSNEIFKVWLRLYDTIDQPFGDPAILLNSVVANAASKEVGVLISGDGADEIFCGYPRYFDWSNKKTLNFLPHFIFNKVAEISNHRGLQIRSESNPLIRYLMVLDSFKHSPGEIEHAISLCDFTSGISTQISKREDFPRLIDIKTYLTGMLFKVDRSSMASSIEARVPFLDNKIIEYGLSQPSFLKEKPLKWRLKELLLHLAPQFNPSLPKKGFSFPLLDWMASDWHENLVEMIHGNNMESLGMEKKQFHEEIKKFRSGDKTLGYKLWIDFNLLQWYESKKSLNA